MRFFKHGMQITYHHIELKSQEEMHSDSWRHSCPQVGLPEEDRDDMNPILTAM